MFQSNRSLLIASLLVGSAITASASAQDAETRGDGVRLHLGTGIGAGGELEAEVEDQETEEFDLGATPSLRVGLEVPLHTNFTLGAELGLAFWLEDDADTDRQLQIDVLARPKVRFPVLDGLEVYGVVPVGLTYYVPRDRDIDDLNVEYKGGPGFAVGGALGASYFITDGFGITAELGYLYRKFKASIETPGGDLDAKLKFGQFQANVGVALAF